MIGDGGDDRERERERESALISSIEKRMQLAVENSQRERERELVR